MTINVPYNLLILSAFRSTIKFADRRKIKVAKLDDYIASLIEEVKGEYQEESIVFKALIDKWDGEIEFIYDTSYLTKFLDKYSSLFTIRGDTIVASDDLDYDDIFQMMNKELNQGISNRFLYPMESIYLLKKLGISRIIKEIETIINLEKNAEAIYEENASFNTGTSSLWRLLFLSGLKPLPYYRLEAYLIIATQIMEVEEDKFDFSPIDPDKFLESSYYSPLGEEILGNYLNKAIFGSFPLYYEKVVWMIEDAISYHDLAHAGINLEIEEDDLQEASSLLEEDETKFCFNYLAKLDEFIDYFGTNPNLIKARQRLLYVIDNPNMELNEEENVRDYIASISDDAVDDGSILYNYAFEAYLMCDEVFRENFNATTIKKILFIATYYNLTLDKKIEELIDKHFKDSKYSDICNLIFGDIRTITLDLELDE